jgi:hypothetical protein
MKNQTSLFGSLTLFACSAMAAGCMGSSESSEPSESSESTNEHNSISLDEVGAAKVASSGQVRVENGSMQILGEGWQSPSPGIFQKGSHRIIMGAAGHQTALAEAKQGLAAARAGGDAQLIFQSEANLKSLETSAAAASKDSGPVAQATCNINFILGPSGPLFGIVGAVGATEISCSVGTQVFTTQSQACTDLGCSPVLTFTNTVGTTPWLSGVIQQGTAGAACVAVTIPTPPGSGFQWNGPCG